MLTFSRANSRQQMGRLRLREGKRLAQGHTAIQWQNQELNQRCKVHLTLLIAPSLNPSPAGSISCNWVGIQDRPLGLSPGKSSVPLPSHPNTGHRFETQGACSSPRRALQATRAAPVG